MLRLADGTLGFLGRADDQLKVRGHRIEPEEIEHALRVHPAVREAVVVLADRDLLVAHVLVAPAAEPDDAELRTNLGKLLRPALIPQRFVRHTELPHTANGKLDRRALRQFTLTATNTVGPTQPPETAEERLVASMYEDLLGVSEVGRLDEFFRLGGHSLTATSLLHRLEQVTGIRVPLHIFVLDTSVAAVARQLEQDHALETAIALLESMSDEQASLLADGSSRENW